MKIITEEEGFLKMASYCSTAEHCRAEICEKLLKWGLSYEIISRILERLEDEKYVDEERYCRAYVKDKFRFSKWGKMKIAQGLYVKKIPSDMAWRYLNEIDLDDYLSILRQLIASKRKSVHAKDEYERTGKLMRFALGRGFEMKDIKQCVHISEEEQWED